MFHIFTTIDDVMMCMGLIIILSYDVVVISLRVVTTTLFHRSPPKRQIITVSFPIASVAMEMRFGMVSLSPYLCD